MPTLTVNGARLHYTDSTAGKETILFAHGLLWSGRMFEPQVQALQDRFRCITFDLRGQGQSEVTAGGYDLETLTQDAAALIEALGCAPCHFVGLSMGGMVAMRIAARRPELVQSLILLETSADPEPTENIPRYRMLGQIVRWVSIGLVRKPVMKIMFGPTFLNDQGRVAERTEMERQLLANHRIGITRALEGVIGRKSIYDEIASITAPTLIMVGDEDVATVPAKAQRIQEQIAGSQLVLIPCAGHTSCIEQPGFVTQQIEKFLASEAVRSRSSLLEPA